MHMNHRKRILVLAGLLLLSALPLLGLNGAPSTPTAPPAPVEEPTAVAPLLDLLSFVPDTPENRSMVTFGDMDAWYAATGYERIDSLDGIDALSDAQREATLFVLPTQTLPPDALGLQYLRTDNLRERLGFNYFDAAQMLQAGQPPDLVTAVNVHADPAAIGAVLETAGYTATEANAATLYTLRGDYEIDMKDASPVGRLGTLNRVAVIDERADPATVLIARATGVATDALEAHAGDSHSLADDPFYALVAEYLTNDTFGYLGPLVGLTLLPPMPGDPMVALGLEGEALQQQVEQYQSEPMPPTLLNAFATFRDGESTVLMLFVVLPPESDAEATGALLYDRLDTYVSLRTQDTLDGYWTREAYGTVVADGIPAAYVTMRLTDTPGNRFNWQQLIATRDLLFLTPGTQP